MPDLPLRDALGHPHKGEGEEEEEELPCQHLDQAGTAQD